MNERDFEQLLYQEADHLSPQKLSTPLPTPWKRALKQLCWGLALTSITLNFLYLDYLLPTLGGVLVWLGLRSLRRQNAPFQAGYLLSWLMCLLRLVNLTLLATPVSQNSSLLLGLYLFGSLVTWLLYLCLWLGLRGVFHQAHLSPKTRSAGWLVIGYGLLLGLALFPFGILLLVLPLLILWILLLVGLFRTHRSLDQAGYAVRPAPVRVSNRWATLTWLGLTALSVVVALSLSLRLPMQGVEPLDMNTQHSQLRTQLEQLGFPAHLLQMLPDEQVEQLERATYIEVDSGGNYAPDADVAGLSMEVVEVMFSHAGEARMYAFFQWDTPPEHRMLEGIRLLPNVQQLAVPLQLDQPQGVLQWEEDGQSFQAPLGTLFTAPPEILLSASPQGYPYADLTFSLPKEGEHIRGYVSWTLGYFSSATNLNAQVTYLHQESPLLYPWDAPCNVYRNQSHHYCEPFEFYDSLVLVQYPGPTT